MSRLLTPVLLFIGFNIAMADVPLRQPLPEAWAYTDGAVQQLPDEDGWWRQFNDPVLDSLITLGVANNFDVSMAMYRMDAASRQVAQARAAYFPTIGLSAGYTRSHSGGASANNFALGANASWEIDLFGRITAQVRQSRADYRASRAEWTGTMVSLAGQIATTYVQLRQWESELMVARQHTVAQDSISGLVRSRFDAGLGSKAALDQSLSMMYSTRSTIPGLKSQVAQARSALALLVGVYPAEIEEMLDSRADMPEYRAIVAAGVPAELLRRRPDILAAEAQVAAAAAAVGIARKDYLPTLSLTGSVGVAAPRVGDMFTHNGFNYSVAPTLSWTLFDGMARRAGVAAANDRLMAQIDSYNYTVMNACNEVDNALIAYGEAVRQIDDCASAHDYASEFLDLEVDLYTQGLAPYNEVATAQANLLNYTNSLIAAQASALNSLIKLYVALGGGF